MDYIVNERLVEARKARAMSQETLAYALGVSQRDLGLWKNGHVPLPLEKLFDYMRVLEFPKGFFYQEKWERV
ncbi:helix-turn-helix transcriptional regulator [Desulfosporosinus metallidurans]